jgi:PAS domain S-box-containing protein
VSPRTSRGGGILLFDRVDHGVEVVGALAGAFDAMVDAIEEKNAALGRAADDETRLRNRLEAVIAGMSDALVAVDTAGAVTACNRAAEALLGVRAEAAIGRQVTAVVVLAEGDGTDAMERIRSLDARPWTALARVTGPDGTAVPVAVSSGAVLGPGAEVVGTVLVLRDLRREHELERMKSEFLARVGHELRTPLTGILGYADILMRRDVSTAQARQWHGEILDAAKRQLRVVQLLEFFASAEAGRVMLRPAPTDVDRLVTDAVDAWAERLPDGFRIMTRLETDLPPVVADRRWTVLALGELIDNAVKFSTGAGQVVVRAARAEGAGGAGVVAISVSDRGPGMSLEEQARAFGDFEQGDASDTRSHGGLGLGLSAVLRIVDGLGGAVECRSAPGRGTTITVHLPVAASEHGNAP